MAHSPKISNYLAGIEANAVAAEMATGWIRVYDGTPATDCDTAIGSQVLLSEHRFSSPAFITEVNGLLTADAITSDTDANASGTPTWFRAFKADGTTATYQGTAGTSGTDLIMATSPIVIHGTVDINSHTYQVNKG